MPLNAKSGGAFTSRDMYRKVSGTMQRVTLAYKRVAGAWVAFIEIVANMLTNGTFTGGAGGAWAFDSGGSFAGDKATFTGVPDQKLTHLPDLTLTNGVTYRTTLTISGWTSGAIFIQFTTNGGAPAVSTALFNGNGTHTFDLTANGNNSFRFVASAGGASLSVDDVTLVPL